MDDSGFRLRTEKPSLKKKELFVPRVVSTKVIFTEISYLNFLNYYLKVFLVVILVQSALGTLQVDYVHAVIIVHVEL